MNALDEFIEVVNKDITSKLVENILNVEQIINDDKTFVKIIPQQGFWPIGLFHDNFQCYFLAMEKMLFSINVSYKFLNNLLHMTMDYYG